MTKKVQLLESHGRNQGSQNDAAVWSDVHVVVRFSRTIVHRHCEEFRFHAASHGGSVLSRHAPFTKEANTNQIGLDPDVENTEKGLWHG